MRNHLIKIAKMITTSHPGVSGPKPHQSAVHQRPKVIKPGSVINIIP
jgi:hypothetical protein